MRVPKSLQRYGGAYHLDDPKNDTSKRTLSLPAPLLEALRQHRNRQREERLAAGPAWQGADWNLILAAPDGSPMYGGIVTKAFRAALERAALPARGSTT